MSFLQNLFRPYTASGEAGVVLTPVSAPAQRPAQAPASRPTEPAPPHPAAPPPREDCVCFPLKAITDLFPPELTTILRKQPSEHVEVFIHRDLIRHQLAAGAVRITFAQLRAATPEIFFLPDAAPPGIKLLLPLEPILRQVTPPRREDQRQPAIPVNIPSIFTKAGQASTVGVPASTAKEAWYSQRRPTYETEPEPDAKVAKAVSTHEKKPYHPIASISNRPRRSADPSDIPPAPPTQPDAAGASSADCLAIPLSSVLAILPPEIRHALNASDARTASFLIPLGEFEARMPIGKLAFTWGQLRDWCTVPLDAPIPPDSSIELPLAAVVPLFMAMRNPPPPRKQIEVDTRVPDVFSKSKFSSRIHVSTPTTPELAPSPAPPEFRLESPAPPPVAPTRPPPAPLPAAPPFRPAPAASVPAQVVEHLRKLDGVTGAFIATADGLLVAGDVADANENVLAAFAPTVFAQLTKYADMAGFGLPESIDIHLGDGATVHVRKAGKLYLGVLVPLNKPLPIDELARLSRTLQPHAS